MIIITTFNIPTFKNLKNDLGRMLTITIRKKSMYSMFMNTEKTEKNTGILSSSDGHQKTKFFTRLVAYIIFTNPTHLPICGLSVSQQLAMYQRLPLFTRLNIPKRILKMGIRRIRSDQNLIIAESDFHISCSIINKS